MIEEVRHEEGDMYLKPVFQQSQLFTHKSEGFTPSRGPEELHN
jgi:hypothetical protein